MCSKIESGFKNSQYYRNYNEINYVILKFQMIKNVYIESKTEYKNQLKNKILEKTKLISIKKFDKTIFENKSNNLFINKICLNSYQKILDEKIKISKDIKKYIKYSKNINEDFIKSVKIGNIKNIDILIQNETDNHIYNDYVIIKFIKKSY